MVVEPSALDCDGSQIRGEDLDRRYLTSAIRRIHRARREAGACYFDANTSRGKREFVVPETQETIRWLGDHRLLLFVVAANPFHSPHIPPLNPKSPTQLPPPIS